LIVVDSGIVNQMRFTISIISEVFDTCLEHFLCL